MTERSTSTGSIYSQRFEPYVEGGQVGARMSLEFQPAAFKIKKVVGDYTAGTPAVVHLVQIAREVGSASPVATPGNIGYAERCVPAGHAEAGWAIDVDLIASKQTGGEGPYKVIADARRPELTSPPPGLVVDYGAQLAVDTAVVAKNLPTGRALSSLDYRYSQQRLTDTIPLFTTKQEGTGGNALRMTDWRADGQNRATLRDNPNVPIGNTLLGMMFQTAVLLQYQAASGPRNRYLVVVSWGWSRSPGKSDVTLSDIVVLQEDGLTPQFQAARTHWNTLTVSDPAQPGAPARPVLSMPDHR